MTIFLTVVVLASFAATFVAGAVYGKQAEAKAIAAGLRTSAAFFEEYRLVIRNLKAREVAAFARIKNLL